MQKLFKIGSHLFTFVSYILGDRSKTMLLQFMSVFCLFSCRSFIVSGLTFRSLTHFEFIFAYGEHIGVS